MGETGIVGGDGVVLCFCFGLVDLGAYAQAAVQGGKKSTDFVKQRPNKGDLTTMLNLDIWPAFVR